MFDVKETISQSNRVLYVVATINKDAILATDPQMSDSVTPASLKISIEDIIKNVNPTDKKLLTIIPAQFLSEDQLTGKRQGLKEEGEYIRNKAERKNRTNNYYVKMTRDRIDNAIKQYGVKWSDSYSEAYMAYINPKTFVSLNSSDPDTIANTSRPINGSELANETQTPFIKVNLQTGEITGHEGRHRMQALANAGVDRIAVLVVDEGKEGRNNRNRIDELTVQGKNNQTAVLTDLVPVNNEHREELIDKFEQGDKWFSYSTAESEEGSKKGSLSAAADLHDPASTSETTVESTSEDIISQEDDEVKRKKEERMDREYLQAIKDGDKKKQMQMS